MADAGSGAGAEGRAVAPAAVASATPAGDGTATGLPQPPPEIGSPEARIGVRDLTMAYGSFVLMRDLNFGIRRGSIFVIMGGSGCGKTTLLKHMIGLVEPARGEILYGEESFTRATGERRQELLRSFGVTYQQGALWSSKTLAENVALPLEQYTDLSAREIREICELKLALVGLKGFEDYYPSQISGGMRKRAGLARAMALDPDVLFFDEPSAGLDPISSHLLDELILELRDSLGSTVVLVTHELPSIFAIADDSVFLDTATRTMAARGNPRELLRNCDDPTVHRFLTRGAEDHPERRPA